jgi:hypothetical protein
MGPPPAKYLKGHYLNFKCFLLHNTCSHLQWPQMISLWHKNPNGEIIRTTEGITWGNTVHAISSSKSIGDELNWANIWSSCWSRSACHVSKIWSTTKLINFRVYEKKTTWKAPGGKLTKLWDLSQTSFAYEIATFISSGPTLKLPGSYENRYNTLCFSKVLVHL